jgi:O-antigen ligase
MSARARERGLTLDSRSVPLVALTLGLVINFFWRAQLFTGNNLPPVVLLSVAFAGLWLLHGLGVSGVLRLRVPRVFWPVALYVFAVLLSIVARSDYEARSIEHALRLLVLLLLVLLVSNVTSSLGTLEGAVYLLMAGFTLAALYGLADYLVSGRYYLNVFRGIERKNASGYYFMAIIPFMLFCLRSPHVSRTARRWMIAGALLCFVALILTLARSAALSLAAGLAAVFLLYERRFNWRLLLLLPVLLAATWTFAPDSVRYRFSQTLNFEQRAGSSTNTRVILLRAGLEMVRDYPVFGVGIGRFDENVERYLEPQERSLLKYEAYEASHNQYVTVLNEGGVLALVGVVWLFWEVLRSLHKRLRRPNVPRRYLLLGLAAFWWGSAANFLVEFQMARELFWFMLGITGAALQLTGEDGAVDAFLVSRVPEAR